MSLSRKQMVDVIRRYYDACNAADHDGIASSFTPGGAHYFPAGAPQGTFFTADQIADGWCRSVAAIGSQWTIDGLTVDEERQQVCIEWTHWKTKLGLHLRGTELVEFAPDGRITEIRAFYAAPAQPAPAVNHELGDFDYAGRGYPLAVAVPEVAR